MISLVFAIALYYWGLSTDSAVTPGVKMTVVWGPFDSAIACEENKLTNMEILAANDIVPDKVFDCEDTAGELTSIKG